MDSLPFHLLEEILFKLDPKSLAIMQCTDKSINSHISNDLYFKSNVKGSIPIGCDSSRDCYEFTPSLSSAMELDDKVDVMKMAHDDKRISGLSMIKKVIDKISPYVQNLLKQKETRLGKRVLIEDGTNLKMEVPSSASSKFINVERINKRIRVK